MAHPTTIEPAARTDSLLTVEGVRVEFEKVVAVAGVSFAMQGGELLGLVGPNGAGKTTLLRVLAGLQAPTAGMAYILGKPVLGSDESVRHQIGFAPDNPPAYEEVTIEQFLRFIAGAYDLSRNEGIERIDFWLDQLWLTEKRDTPIKELSRGMRQRVTLARTFLPNPHVILLDEPLSGLDPAGRIQLRKVLSMLRDQGCAMLVSSHILSDLEEVSTHIAIIEHGSILRWTRADAIHAEDERLRTWQLGIVGDPSAARELLVTLDGVESVRSNGEVLLFDFTGDGREAALLLRKLVEQGLLISHFAPVKRTLEEAYLRAGLKQVD